MNNLSPIVLQNSSVVNLDIKENSNYIIVNDLEESINININKDTNLELLLFSKLQSKINLNVTINENANLKVNVISMNNQTNDIYNIDLIGAYAQVEMNLLSLAKNGKKEFLFNVSHLAPETKSTVSNNSISFENGKNIFKVNGIIKPNMKNSDVRQITKGLILDPSGECLAEPILLIDYHDVKAYHGATIGKINDEDLFYLMSRGLSKEESFMLIINGLLEPFVRNLNDEVIKDEVMKKYYSYF